jgi:hypothetical protein
MLIPLSASRAPTSLPDRVFLGGPNSIRGWKIGGIGARDGGVYALKVPSNHSLTCALPSGFSRRRSCLGNGRFRLCALPYQKGVAGQASWFHEYWQGCRMGVR